MSRRVESLRRRVDFVRAQSQGKKTKGKHLLVIAATGEADKARLGITVSRRVGNAVVRNRVRRRIREIVRPLATLLPVGFDIVVVAFPEAASATFATLKEELTCLVSRARDWASAKPSS